MTSGMDELGDLIKLVGGVTPTEETEIAGTTETPTKTPITETDTIQQSEQDAQKKTQLPDTPGMINLEQVPPNRADVEAFLFMFNKVEVGIINNILDVWAKGIEENKKADEAERARAIRMGLDQVGKFLDGLGVSYVDETKRNDMAAANLTAFTMMAALSLSQLGPVADPTVLMGVHNLNASIFSVIPAELHASMATVGALATSALMAPVFLKLTSEAEATRGQLPDNALANQVAFVAADMVKTGLVKDLISADPRLSGLSADQKAELIAKTNLTFLIGALALFYEKETGWITEEELVDMLNRGAIFEQIKADNPDDPRLSLVPLIRQELGSLSEAEKREYLRETARHFSSNPAFESSQELMELLEKMWANMDYEQMSESAA